MVATAEERRDDLLRRGVEAGAAKTASVSPKLYESLIGALAAAGNPAEKKTIALVNSAVTKVSSKVGPKGRDLLFRSIGDGRVSSNTRLEAAMAFLVEVYGVKGNLVKVEEEDVSIDEKEYDEAIGVGIVVGREEIERVVDQVLEERRSEIVELRYEFNANTLLRPVMKKLRFAEGKEVSSILHRKLEDLLGPKTEEDERKRPKKKKKQKSKKENENEALNDGMNDITDPSLTEPSDPFEGIPRNMIARDLDSALNSETLVEKHRLATGGKVITRFPPEPNGYLHIGHAKAMFLDFGYARKMGGECILRYDDTNPTVEKTEYIDSIKEMVLWMGHTPDRVTYSSDYFQKLYELAKELIRRGKAYVCHQTSEEMSRDRKNKVSSPWRDRAPEESLRLFEDMRKGKYGEGEATLRMKINMQDVNPVMRDPIAYRVKHAPHPRSGDKWCIYPSYDYTHCIVDSLEWITHSLCTLEFEIRRDSYYWLLEALDLYRPFVWEFSRLNITNTIMSKRRLLELVTEGVVRGWDDPRMPTLSGMRRRGYPQTALNKFCAAVGVSRGKNTINYSTLEYWVRADLDPTVPRAFVVLDPLRVVILNFRGEEKLTASNHPKKSELGTRDITFTQTIFIEAHDFREKDSKGYYGLAPGKTAMLRYAFPITVDSVIYDAGGSVVELRVICDYGKSIKTKGVLHWVNGNATMAEVRMYDKLFCSEDPSLLDKSTWMEDLNPKSETVLEGARIEDSLRMAKAGDRFQFERIGYFACDFDSSATQKVFNLTVSLRDSR